MPELPEAETIARGLAPLVTGRRVVAVRFHARRVADRRTRAAVRRRVVGRAIAGVGRRAKTVLMHLERGDLLAVQLRMTGRLVWVPPQELGPAAPGTGARRGGRGGNPARTGARSPVPELRHVRATIELDDGSRLLFDDARQFGSVTFFRPDEWAAYAARFGPEPLEPGFTPEHLAACLRRARRAAVKAVLLDPRCAAGVGNVYANEACFVAGVRPTRPARRVTRAEVERLHAAVRQVLREAIAARGTSFRDFRDHAGAPGGYQRALRVYDRAGAPCVRCGAPIRRALVAGRSAFYCPRCQR